MKIVFFGTPDYAAIILKHLIFFRSRIGSVAVEAVVTGPDKPIGRGQKLQSSPVKQLALKHHLPVIDTPKMTEVVDQARKIKPDLIVLAAYMRLLPAELLAIPRFGCLNVHPSLLPKYAGVSPIQQVILAGEDETGVTIIKMNERYDEGAIVAQEKLAIQVGETRPELEERLAELGGRLLTKTIPDWTEGKITPKSQNPELVRRFYTKKLSRDDGYVSWIDLISALKGKSLASSSKIERMVRALSPWPGIWTTIAADAHGPTSPKRLKIIRARLEGEKLVIDQAQVEGKKPISWQEFASGHQLA